MAEEKKNIWDSSHLWAEELDMLKNILNKTPLVETTKWGAPTYTYNGKNVLGLGGFKNFFTIWFYKGVCIQFSEKRRGEGHIIQTHSMLVR